MTYRSITRTAVAAAATAVAVGSLTLLGGGTAAAAEGSAAWDDYYSHFTRTISETSPNPGDTVTVTTKFERTNDTPERLYWIKDHHPTCLTYVPGSAKISGNRGTLAVEPKLEVQPGFVAADISAGNWTVQKNPAESPVLTVKYKVGADCSRGNYLATGMEYNGTLGAGSYATKGPSISISYLGGDAGSLGSLFGS
ncbi:hypothetical protein [Rhodococcus sp. NPDC127528]|uniref:hypothetical protein n=1 Tax=unclassified Rhodococcus (in: high G+C Gram-positive bacteria) TaxID=192944 RepID=UPI003638AED0